MMKKQEKALSEKSTSTVIGEGIIIENAVLKGAGVIRIDGKFSGNIEIEGHIILGEKGSVIGDIHAGSALFAGKYEGNLTIADTLHLTPGAYVTGLVDTGKIIIDEDAVFNGTCNMNNNTEASFNPLLSTLEAPV